MKGLNPYGNRGKLEVSKDRFFLAIQRLPNRLPLVRDCREKAVFFMAQITPEIYTGHKVISSESNLVVYRVPNFIGYALSVFFKHDPKLEEILKKKKWHIVIEYED